MRVPDLLLINEGDLAYAKIRLDPRSLATVTESLGTLDDSLARGLCWAAAWDMLRDAELPARRYLDLVLANVAGEDQIAVVAGLLRNAEAAAVVYGDPANREPARRRLAEHALTSLRSAAPGSDVQLAYARAFAAAARGDDHLALVRGLLDGRAIDGVEGLTVDTELRWVLVRSLATAGVDDAPALIDAEEERDATDAGARYAAADPGRPAAPAAQGRGLVGAGGRRSPAGGDAGHHGRLPSARPGAGPPGLDRALLRRAVARMGASRAGRRHVVHRDALPGRAMAR